MKRTVLSIIVLLFANTAAAQLSKAYGQYFEGPEGFLLTKQERKAWKEVTTDAEAEEFIALFWAKRDPDLSTVVNEFRLDFDQRVKAADILYGYESMRGALSDRACVLILLGKYSRRNNFPPGAVASDVQSPGTATMDDSRMVPSGSLYQNRGSTEIWEYWREDLPVRIGQNFVVAYFLETEVDDNDYVLDRSNSSLMHVLGKAPEALIVNPDLTEVPPIGLIPNSRPASVDQLRWFDGEERSWPETASIVADVGLAPGSRHYLWVHLCLGEEVPEDISVVGRLRAEDSSEEVGSFVVPASEITQGGDACELSIPVGGGRWLLDLALADDMGPIASTTVAVQTAETPLEGTCISPFVWGTSARQVPNWKVSDPFSIGGWRMDPVLDTKFSTSSDDNLSYMAYVFEPELDDEGSPQFMVTISLSKDGRQVAKTPAQSAPLSKLGEGVWMFGRGLPLAGFSEPGSYTLKIELEQTTDGAKGSVEIPFEMVQAETASDGQM